MYKICRGLLPNWLFSFPTMDDVNERQTRQSNNLYVKGASTDIGARAITCKGPKKWNNISKTIRDSASLGLFQSELKLILLNR